ncbi:serine hydrolase domain-containing protein [Brevibacillus sp. MER 51]|uniref:serine hydrolase n=1 Tax=Brevibacillus sp. MER 51 TaxID=2939560 RepID=UPI0020414F4A|nr:serine hydrolase domain-containing protein [Brevibacillus sp. MER 51]MCM3141262.1 beta-lactamase family protein [Brevibacillus sp. MER 51]
MTHTAGLPYRFFQEEKGTYELAGVSDGMDLAGITLEENLQRLASVPLQYEPGKMWRYSIATDVLGAVIEKVTGMPLSEAVRMLVTHPLSMMDTDFKAVEQPQSRTWFCNAWMEVGEFAILLTNKLERKGHLL